MPTINRARYTKSILAYSEIQQLNPAIASTASYVYSLNGLFDPNITGAGQQPTGFDQYMALYEFYTVLKAKVKIRVLNQDATSAQIVGCNIQSTSGTSTDYNVYLRNNNQDFKIIDKIGSGNSTCSFEFEVDLSKLAAKSIWTDGEYSGTQNNNPANQWYLVIWSAPADGSSDVGITDFWTQIEYLTAFRETASTLNS